MQRWTILSALLKIWCLMTLTRARPIVSSEFQNTSWNVSYSWMSPLFRFLRVGYFLCQFRLEARQMIKNLSFQYDNIFSLIRVSVPYFVNQFVIKADIFVSTLMLRSSDRGGQVNNVPDGPAELVLEYGQRVFEVFVKQHQVKLRLGRLDHRLVQVVYLTKLGRLETQYEELNFKFEKLVMLELHLWVHQVDQWLDPMLHFRVSFADAFSL